MEQYKHNELTFQQIVEATPNALILVNNLGKIAYANNFTEKLLQYTKNELIGKELEILIPNKYSEAHPHLMQSYFNNPTSRQMGKNMELHALKKDGSEFPVEIGLNPIRINKEILTLASILDITERKKTEKQFRLIVESIPNAIILVNLKGEITMVNTQTEIQFGYVSEELVGKKMELLIPNRFKKIHPEHRNKFFTNSKTRPMGAGRDLYALRKDGSEFPAEIGLNPIETSEGTLILASIINITERKEYENVIKENVEKIKIKNKKLLQSEQKLKESNATKDRLFEIIGHDLRGPIGGFKQLIDILISDFDLNETETLSGLLKSVQGTAATTYDLLENILLWAKSQQNNITISPIICNFNEITNNTIILLQQVAIQKKITIHNKIPKNQTIYADVNMVTTVIRNLISNAIKFTPNNKNIFVSINNYENYSTISVKDEGLGISIENINKIFNPNINFTSYGTNNEKGSGLGLMLCQEFIEKHNGKLWVESELGKGSDFKFTLPLNKS